MAMNIYLFLHCIEQKIANVVTILNAYFLSILNKDFRERMSQAELMLV